VAQIFLILTHPGCRPVCRIARSPAHHRNAIADHRSHRLAVAGDRDRSADHCRQWSIDPGHDCRPWCGAAYERQSFSSSPEFISVLGSSLLFAGHLGSLRTLAGSSANGDLSIEYYDLSRMCDWESCSRLSGNNRGGTVSGLQQRDFRVDEDGQPQVIRVFHVEHVPVAIGLVVDNSGSMTKKRSGVIAAVVAFARSSNQADQMFIVNFNENATFGLPDTKLFSASVTAATMQAGAR
jgi:hypothetical protein